VYYVCLDFLIVRARGDPDLISADPYPGSDNERGSSERARGHNPSLASSLGNAARKGKQ
jgi:hypothetical protein